MKIIITESQLIDIIESQQYLDKLLDKINDSGIDSLSDEERDHLNRISSGEDIDEPSDENNEYEEKSDLYQMFLHYALEQEDINVNNKVYHTEMVDEMGNEYIRVIGDDIDLYVTPFKDEREGIVVEKTDGTEKFFKLDHIPQNETEMMDFVEKFYMKFLPFIIKKLS